MFIQNISYGDVKNGHHIFPGDNAMMINIVDPGMEFPTPKYKFREIHRFEFLDLEKQDYAIDEEMKISEAQAQELVTLLQSALERRMNVIVSCVAGVCRSGAVCEVGVMLGFDDTEAFRSPNLLVKHRMMKALGLQYSDDEPRTINGVPFQYDDLNNKVLYEQTESGLWIPPKKEDDQA